MLVGTGQTIEGKLNFTEIIDIGSPNITCSCPPTFPQIIYGAIAALGFQKQPLICGGMDSSGAPTKNCYTLQNNEWILTFSMNSSRAYSSVSQSPSLPVVTGGMYDKSNT